MLKKRHFHLKKKDFTLIDWWLSIFKFAPQYTQEMIAKLKQQGIVMPPIIAQALYRLYFPKWNPREIREYKTDTLDKENYVFHYAIERAEGKVEGKTELLIQLLEARFGKLSQNHIDHIMSATSDKLKQWGINMFQAQSLEEIFNSSLQ